MAIADVRGEAGRCGGERATAATALQ